MSRKQTAGVSLCEIARRLNVTSSTVSRALSGHPSISEPTRRKTLALAQELGYQPNKRLQRFFKSIHHQSHTVVLLSTASEYAQMRVQQDPFFVRIQLAVQDALRTAGFHMVLANAAADLMPDGNLSAVADGVADGVITILPDRPAVERLATHAPVVVFNTELRCQNVDVVIPDVERCARAQMDYLRELGHRRIACFRPRSPGNHPCTTWQDRRFWRGYEEYSRELGVALPREYLEPIEFESRAHAGAIGAFLERVWRADIAPTALLTYDLYAVELIRQLAERGRRVPDDISVVGFDDYLFGELCPVALTTFRQNFETMAKVAVQLLRERLQEPQQPARVVEVAGTMIERTSAAVAAQTETFGRE